MKKEVVNVRSQEEWDYVTDKLGYKWDYIKSWNEHKENSVIDTNEKGFSYINHSAMRKYNIISFSEFKQRYEGSNASIPPLYQDRPCGNVIFSDKEDKEELIKQYIPKSEWWRFDIKEEIVLRDWEELKFPIEKTSYASAYLPTKKHAKSMIAFAKLSMLMADLGEECNVDWSDQEIKYTIRAEKNNIRKTIAVGLYYFLAFKTEEVRDLFFEKHYDLIKEYEML